jgi:hypothetical protein
VRDIFWRCYVNAMLMQPKIFERMNQRKPGPVKMPALWQVMITPVLILIVAFLLSR